MKSSSYIVAMVLIFIVTFGIYYFYPSAFPLSVAIAFFALVLSAINIFVARESIRMGAILKHSNDLHKFIVKWHRWQLDYYKNEILKITSNIRPAFWSEPRDALDQFSHSEVLYKDLMDSHIKHLPTKYSNFRNLDRLWKNYDRLEAQYRMACNDFYDDVRRMVFKEVEPFLGKTDKTSYAYNGNDVLTENYIGLVYSRNVNLSPSSRMYAYKELNLTSREVNQTLNKKIGSSIVSETIKYYELILQPEDAVLAMLSNKKAIEFYEVVFKLLYNGLEVSSRTNKTFELWQKVGDANLDLLRAHHAISQKLENLSKYSVFSGNCDFIQV